MQEAIGYPREKTWWKHNIALDVEGLQCLESIKKMYMIQETLDFL